jgi:hypothetical protein
MTVLSEGSMKTRVTVPQKIQHEVPCDPAIPHQSSPKRTKHRDLRDKCTPMFTAALFTRAKRWKQPGCLSTNERGRSLQRNFTQH